MAVLWSAAVGFAQGSTFIILSTAANPLLREPWREEKRERKRGVSDGEMAEREREREEEMVKYAGRLASFSNTEQQTNAISTQVRTERLQGTNSGTQSSWRCWSAGKENSLMAYMRNGKSIPKTN